MIDPRSPGAAAVVAALLLAPSGCGRSGLEGEPDAAGEDGPSHAADAGETEVLILPLAGFRSVWGSSSSDVYVLDDGFELRSKIRFDGASWSLLEDHHVDPSCHFWQSTVEDIGGSSPDDIYAVGIAPGSFIWPPTPVEYAWRFDGERWSLSLEVDPLDYLDPLVVVSELRSAWSISPSSAWAAGHGLGEEGEPCGIILRFDGWRWTRREHGRFPFLEGIWGESDTEVFSVGREGTILRLQGRDWEPMESPVGTDLLAVWGRSGREVYAVGMAGTILRFDGTAWSVMESGTVQDLHSVWGDTAGDTYAVGMAGTILALRGETWEAVESNTDADLHDVWGSSATDVYAVGGARPDPDMYEIGIIVHFDGAGWSGVEDLPVHTWP